MRPIRLPWLGALAVAATASGCAGRGPESYTSEAGNFRAEFRGTPKVSVQDVSAPGAGSVPMHVVQSELPDRTSYSVFYADYPSSLDQADPDRVLDGVATGLAQGMGGSAAVPAQQPIALAGHPGREFSLQVRDSGHSGTGRVRIYLVGRRLYQILFIADSARFTAAEADRFLSSFALLHPIPPRAAAGRTVATPTPPATASAPPPARAEPTGPGRVPDSPAESAAPPATAPDLSGSLGMLAEALKSGAPADAPAPAAPGPDAAAAPPEPGVAGPTDEAGGASLVEFRWMDESRDVVGGHGDAGRPDGTPDQHFRLTLDLPPKSTIEEMTLTSGGFHKFVTRPTPGLWAIAIHEGDRVVAGAHTEQVGPFTGRHEFDLFANTGLGLERPGTEYDLEVVLAIDGRRHVLRSSCRRPDPDHPEAPGAPAAAGGASILAFRWVDETHDVIGPPGRPSAPDGWKDQHLQLELDLPDGAVIEELTLKGPGINEWVTRQDHEHWPVVVHEGGKALTSGYVETVGAYAGRRTFDLYGNTGFDLGPGTPFEVRLVVMVGEARHTLGARCRRP